MLHVVHSNYLPVLAAHLRANMQAHPLHVMQPEVIVVPSRATGVWLQHHLAQTQGIAANLQMELIPSLVRGVMQLLQPHATDVPFEPSLMRWTVDQALTYVLQQPQLQAQFAPLSNYLVNDKAGLKRYVLVERITACYDQYALARPQWLAQWLEPHAANRVAAPFGFETLKVHRWQAPLWREVVRLSQEGWLQHTHEEARENTQSVLPSSVWLDQTTQLIKQLTPEQVVLLHQHYPRLHVMGGAMVTPQFLEFITQLAQHIDIALLHQTPSRVLWDVAKPAELVAQESAMDEAQFALHPLLSTWGAAGRETFAQIGQLSAQTDAAYLVPPGSTALAALQRSILEAQWPLEHGLSDGQLHSDDSIRLMDCYSRLREVEELHDYLCARFAQDPSLTQRDVVVMMPQVNDYAHLLRAVFNQDLQVHTERAQLTQRFRIAIQDRPDPPLQSFLTLLFELVQLPQATLSRTQVQAWLSTPAIAQRYGLTQLAQEPQLLERWLQQAAVQFGAGDVSQLNKAQQQVSWLAGLQRLTLGIALPQGQQYAGLSAVSMPAGDLPLLTGLIECVHSLKRWQARLSQAHTLEEWVDLTTQLVNEFFDEQLLESDHEAVVNSALDALRAQAHQSGYAEQVSNAVWARVLQGAIEQSQSIPGVTGAITCSALAPLRAVPYRVVCILGLNDGQFPRTQVTPSFDLVQATLTAGDRTRRTDDMYQLLEALCAAQDALYISWVGRDERNGATLAPSLCVSQLQRVLNQAFGAASQQWVVRSPVHALSTQQAQRVTYAAQWYDPQQHPLPAVMPPSPSLGPLHITAVEIGQVLRDASAAWLANALHIQAPWQDSQAAEEENFSSKPHEFATQRQLLQQQLRLAADQTLSAAHKSEHMARWTAGTGMISVGPDQVQQAATSVQAALQVYEQLHQFAPDQTLSVRLTLQPQAPRLVEIKAAHAVVPAQCVVQHTQAVQRVGDELIAQYWTPTKVSAGYIMACWVKHVALCAGQPGKVTAHLLGVADDKPYHRYFVPIEQSLAQQLLAELMWCMLQMQARATPFFVKTALKFCGGLGFEPKPSRSKKAPTQLPKSLTQEQLNTALHGLDSDKIDSALQVASKEWLDTANGKGESLQWAHQRLWSDYELSAQSEFVPWALGIMAPLSLANRMTNPLLDEEQSSEAQVVA